MHKVIYEDSYSQEDVERLQREIFSRLSKRDSDTSDEIEAAVRLLRAYYKLKAGRDKDKRAP